MALVVVNCPLKMVSLSEAALRKVDGIVHTVDRIVGYSDEIPTGKNFDMTIAPRRPRRDLLGTFNVWTMCGKQIDAYPETEQGRTPCSGCERSKKPPPDLLLTRIISPTRERGWEFAYWERFGDGYVRTLIERSAWQS